MSEEFIPDPVKSYKPRQPVVVAQPATEKPVQALTAERTPRTTEEMIARAATLTDLSLEALESIVRHGDKDSDRIAAATALLDRGHGKPTQQLTIRSNEGSTIEGQFEEIKRLTGKDIRDGH
jgi:hypothetical protein